jgi:WD40 repeat protein
MYKYAVVILQYIALLIIGVVITTRVDSQAPDRVYALDFNQDGSKYAVGRADRTIDVVDASTQAVLVTAQIPDLRIEPSQLTFDINRIVFSPDGTKLAVAVGGSASGGWMFVVDAANGQILKQIRARSYASVIDWSPNGTQLIGLGSVNHRTNPLITLFLWDATTGQVIHEYGGLELGTYALDGHPTQSKVAYADHSNIVIWDTDNWNKISQLSGHTDILTAVNWSPDGNTLAGASSNGEMRLWDSNTGQLLFSFEGHTDYVTQLAWNSNSSQVASSSRDGTIRIWDATNGQAIKTIQATGLVFDLEWKPNSTELLYVDVDGQIEFASASKVKFTPTLPDFAGQDISEGIGTTISFVSVFYFLQTLFLTG